MMKSDIDPYCIWKIFPNFTCTKCISSTMITSQSGPIDVLMVSSVKCIGLS